MLLCCLGSRRGIGALYRYRTLITGRACPILLNSSARACAYCYCGRGRYLKRPRQPTMPMDIIYLKSSIHPKPNYQNPNYQQRNFQPSFCKHLTSPSYHRSDREQKGAASSNRAAPLFSIETNGIKGYTITQLLGVHPNNHEAIRGRVSSCFRGLRAATRSPHETQGISLIRKFETGPLDHFPFQYPIIQQKSRSCKFDFFSLKQIVSS